MKWQPNATHDIYVTTEILQSSQNSSIQGEDVRPTSGLLTRYCVMRFVDGNLSLKSSYFHILNRQLCDLHKTMRFVINQRTTSTTPYPHTVETI